MDTKGFGERLSAFRLEKRLSQQDIASALGISQPSYGKAENGHNFLSPENLSKLNEIYGLNINWLLTGKGEMLEPKGNCGRELHLVSWDVGPVLDDQTLHKSITAAIRHELWALEEERVQKAQDKPELVIDADQLIALQFILLRMASSLGRVADPLMIRCLLALARGPNPNDTVIRGRPRESE